mgnify:CR=1 FL=1
MPNTQPNMFFDNLVVLEIPDMPTLKTNARANISIGTRVVDNLKSSLHIWVILYIHPKRELLVTLKPSERKK